MITLDHLEALITDLEKSNPHTCRSVVALVLFASPDHLTQSVDQLVLLAEPDLEDEDRPSRLG